MVYPHKWSPISYRSSAGQRKHAGQRPTLYRWTTQLTGRSTIVFHDPELREDSSPRRDLYRRRDSRAEMREIPSNKSTGGLARLTRSVHVSYSSVRVPAVLLDSSEELAILQHLGVAVATVTKLHPASVSIALQRRAGNGSVHGSWVIGHRSINMDGSRDPLTDD